MDSKESLFYCIKISDHLYHIDSNHGLNESITLPFIKYKSLN